MANCRNAFGLLLLGLFAVFVAAMPVAAQTSVPGSPSEQRALLDRYCVTCHNGALQTADLELDSVDVNDVSANPAVWERASRVDATFAAPETRCDDLCGIY